MLQFYFLSVLLNILTGLVLCYSKSEDKDDELAILEDDNSSGDNKSSKSIFRRFFGKNSFTDDEMFYLILGILTIFTGLIKLLSAVNGVAVFGDLIPAIAGFLGGGAVLIKYFELRSTVTLEMNEKLHFILVESSRYLGIACIIVGIVHFIIPSVLFL